MDKRKLEIGDVVQINPEAYKDGMFSACFMLVTEPKTWGAMGFILCPESPEPGAAYLRVKFENMEYIGKAKWIPQNELDEVDSDDE